MKVTSIVRRVTLAGWTLALGLIALTDLAPAQCITPDGLDGGPCWERTEVVLPDFPRIADESLWICFRDCDPNQINNCRTVWGIPRPAIQGNIPPVCSVYLSRVEMFDPVTGVKKWTSAMRMWYSRTWSESTPDTRYQVWRFLVNTDLRPRDVANDICSLPPCSPQFDDRVHVWGYIDYALNCLDNTWSAAFALNHDCDVFHHAPGFPRAGVFHPGISYTLVGPGGRFMVSPVGPIEAGPILAEAMRPLDLSLVFNNPPSGDVCIYEEQVQGGIDPLREFCPCAPNNPDATPQYANSFLAAFGSCGTVVETVAAGFPSGLISKGIGTWTDPTRFPGTEYLRLNLGGYRLLDPCRPRDEFEFYFGVTTFRGYDAFQVTAAGLGAPLPLTFLDQGNSRHFSGFTPTLNRQYITDHILNFNLP